MKPVLFVIPLHWPWPDGIPVRAYGFMVMLGCLAAIFVALRRAKREGADRNVIWDLWMWSLIGGFVGARAFYVGLNWPQFRGSLLSVFHIWEGGLAFQGGLIGAILCAYVYMKVRKLPIAKHLDMLVAAMILGYAFARVGCFLNGCCHGHVTDVSWAITYPAAAPVDARGTLRISPAYAAQESGDPRPMPEWANGLEGSRGRVLNGRLKPMWEVCELAVKRALKYPPERERERITERDYLKAAATGNVPPMPHTCPVHPTQLYSAGYALIIFVLLVVYAHLPHRDGQVASLFGVLYAMGRFTVEFFRGDSASAFAGLTLFQLVCVGIFVVFGAAWFWCQYRMSAYKRPGRK